MKRSQTHSHSIPFVSNCICQWHPHFIERNIRRPSRRAVTRLDRLRLHTLTPWNQNHSITAFSRLPIHTTTCNCEVIRPHTICDPLLRPTDYPFVRLGILHGRSLQPRDVAPRESFGYRETNELAAGENVGDDAGLQLGGTEVENWGQADDAAGEEAIDRAT